MPGTGSRERSALIDLTAAFERVVSALEDADLPYVVVGSVAAAAWGVARTTRDVDLVAAIGPADVEAVLGSLDGDELYVNSGDARRAAIDGGSFNVIHPASGGKVDVFVMPPDDPFTRARLARRLRATVLGVETWVDTAENVVLAKLSWRLQSRSETQWRDCVEIAAIEELDRGYMAEWAPSLGVSEDLAELFTLIDDIV
ncbi:MAG: hypothetical protein ACFCVK_25430 [Acidimicrobiales bacterium]